MLALTLAVWVPALCGFDPQVPLTFLAFFFYLGLVCKSGHSRVITMRYLEDWYQNLIGRVRKVRADILICDYLHYTHIVSKLWEFWVPLFGSYAPKVCGFEETPTP